MGPWGRSFPRGTPGRSFRALGPPICGFGACSGGTWPDPRLGTPRSPSGRNFAPRTQGGSGRAVRAPGGRIRPDSTCFPVAPGRLRGPEIPHSGPAPGAPGAAGPERAPGDQYLANLSTPRITRWPLVVVIPPSVLYRLVKTPFTLGHHANSAPQTAGRGPSDTAGTRLRAKHAYLLKCANADACFACTLHIGPASLQYGNTRASRAKVDKSCATKPRFV